MDSAPPVDGGWLRDAAVAMAPRGPDGDGLWLGDDRRIGLAHRRLAILDLSEAGAQPMATPDGALRIAFNGEIYNYPSLRAKLEGRGYRFRSNSDTEALLWMYREFGRDMLRQLRGMFAFALWDATEKGLFVARDALGIKPLYYAEAGGRLRVASQVKALLVADGVDTSPEPAGHVGFFTLGYVPEPWTLYRGVRALPAGTSMWIQHGRILPAPRAFCSVSEEIAAAERAGGVHALAAEEGGFAATLRDSVSAHMLADVPVGVFLSAGLDSTSIAAMAAVHSPQPLRTITLGFSEFRGTPQDEVPLAEMTAARLGCRHTTRWVTPDEFAAERPRVLAAMDQPSIDGVNTYFVSKAAREAGLKVALSGLGGDELLAGYSSFRDVPRIARYARPFGFAGRAFRRLSHAALRRFTSPKYAGLFEYGSTYGGAYLLRRGLYMPWELPDVLDADLVREGWRDLDLVSRLDSTGERIASPRLRVSALELSWYMRCQLLRDADWASMAHSLEVRVPLVDNVLLQAVAGLVAAGSPPGKLDMAAAVSPGSLPAEVLSRPKTGFAVPVRDWLLGDATGHERGLRPWARLIYQQF